MAKKKPGGFRIPESPKKIRTDISKVAPQDQKPVWQVGYLDKDGPWGWREMEPNLFFEQVLPTIKSFESMFWKDILGRNNHAIPVDEIVKEAQQRLVKIHLDDIATLISLRLSGKKRIWGVKIQNILRILWWDPNHEVCPSPKRHT